MEHDDVVDPVEELRPEGRLERFLDAAAHFGLVGPPQVLDELASHVARHDDDRVLEVHGPAVAVGEPPVVQYLEQSVEDVGVRLLHLVEQDDGVRAAPDGLGQLSAFLVSHVAGRGPDQTGDGVLLHVLAHVEAHHRLLVVEEEFGEGASQLGFSDARRPQEEERSDRPVRVLDAGARPPHGVGDGLDGLVLPDDPRSEAFLHPKELLHLRFQHSRDGNPRPPRDDLGNVLLVHLLLEKGAAGLDLPQAGVLRFEVLLERRKRSVFELGRPAQVPLALGLFGAEPRFLDSCLEAPDGGDG